MIPKVLKEVQEENARLKQEWLERNEISKEQVAEFAKSVKEVLHKVRNKDYKSGFMFKVTEKVGK